MYSIFGLQEVKFLVNQYYTRYALLEIFMLNYLVPSVIHIDSSIWYCTTDFYVAFIIIFQGYIITLQLTVLCAKEPRTTITTVNNHFAVNSAVCQRTSHNYHHSNLLVVVQVLLIGDVWSCILLPPPSSVTL